MISLLVYVFYAILAIAILVTLIFKSDTDTIIDDDTDDIFILQHFYLSTSNKESKNINVHLLQHLLGNFDTEKFILYIRKLSSKHSLYINNYTILRNLLKSDLLTDIFSNDVLETLLKGEIAERIICFQDKHIKLRFRIGDRGLIGLE